jgi:hypothetical protein
VSEKQAAIFYIRPALCVVSGLRNLADQIERGESPRPRYMTIVTSDEDVFTFGPDQKPGDRMHVVAEVIFDLSRAQHKLHRLLDEDEGGH